MRTAAALLSFGAGGVSAQQTPPTTPNIGLYLPYRGSYNWDTWYNANWAKIDQAIAQRQVSVKDYGAVGDGVANDAPAIQAAVNAASAVYFPPGTYRLATTIALARSGQRLYSDALNSAVINCITGSAFKAYNNADSGPVVLDVNTFQDVTFEYLNINGGQNITSDYTVQSGRSHTLTSSNLNIGIIAKQSIHLIIRKCRFKGFHRAVVINSGFGNTIEDSNFYNSEVGFYADTGAIYGDPVYKLTTTISRGNTFSDCWFGIYSLALVDNSASIADIFEPVNTGMYLGNSNGVRVASYFEKDWEGLVAAGAFTGTVTVDGGAFYGFPGSSNWGAGNYIYLFGATSLSEVRVSNLRNFNADSFPNANVKADIGSGRIIFDRYVPTASYDARTLNTQPKNQSIHADPLFSRQYVQMTVGAGISSVTWSTDADGNNVLNLNGSGTGVAYNGVMLKPYPQAVAGCGTIRVSYDYQYSGTSSGFNGWALYVGGGYNGLLPLTTQSNTGTVWRHVEGEAPNNAIGFSMVQGGFDGTLKIRKYYASCGYSTSDAYSPNPTNGFLLEAAPTSGAWRVGDVVWNAVPTASSAFAWICTVAGTPGTWVPVYTGIANDNSVGLAVVKNVKGSDGNNCTLTYSSGRLTASSCP